MNKIQYYVLLITLICSCSAKELYDKKEVDHELLGNWQFELSGYVYECLHCGGNDEYLMKIDQNEVKMFNKQNELVHSCALFVEFDENRGFDVIHFRQSDLFCSYRYDISNDTLILKSYDYYTYNNLSEEDIARRPEIRYVRKR